MIIPFRKIDTDFSVGADNFKALIIKSGGNNDGFFYFYDESNKRLIKQFVLGTSKTGIKTCCCVTFIEKDLKYTPRLEFSKRKENGSLTREPIELEAKAKKISARVALDECHENFWDLIDYIYSLKQVAVPRDGWSVIPSADKSFLDKLKNDKDFVDQVLTSFITLDAQKLLLDAKKDGIKNLFAAVKQAKNVKALKEIEDLVINEANESKLEAWIKENEWVFGIEYIRRLDVTRIGLHSDADMLVESLDGFVDLIELKKASVSPLFNKDSSHKCFYPSADLSKVIGQTIHYLTTMEEQRHQLKSGDGLNVLKPRAKIVIGQSSKMDDKERDALRRFNDTLHNIEVLTYDEIKSRAKRIVKHYSDSSRENMSPL